MLLLAQVRDMGGRLDVARNGTETWGFSDREGYDFFLRYCHDSSMFVDHIHSSKRIREYPNKLQVKVFLT